MGIIRSSGASCNSQWISRTHKGVGITYGTLKFIDKSNLKTKRVVSFIKNVSSGAGEPANWQDFFINQSHPFYANFTGPIEVISFFDAVKLPSFIATVGKKYLANDNDIPMDGNANISSEIQIQNGHNTKNLVTIIKKCGRVIECATIAPGVTQGFSYQQKIYLAIKDNEDPIAVEDANTLLSMLGIISCDIEISESSGNYIFNLINIVS